MSRAFLLVSALSSVFLCSAARHATAQASGGTLAGLITDASGARAGGAAVAVRNVGTGQVRRLVTNDDGLYVAPGLQPGAYVVSVELTGFRPVERPAVVLVGTTTVVDFGLEIADRVEVVRVTSAPPILGGDTHQVAGVVTRARMQTIPLNGRDFTELAKLEPGVTPPCASARRALVCRGARRRPADDSAHRIDACHRRWGQRLDAGDVRGAASGVAGSRRRVSDGHGQLRPGDGLVPNGAINIVARSGTNTAHGDAFLFYRDHHLAAHPALRTESRQSESVLPASAGRRGRGSCLPAQPREFVSEVTSTTRSVASSPCSPRRRNSPGSAASSKPLRGAPGRRPDRCVVLGPPPRLRPRLARRQPRRRRCRQRPALRMGTATEPRRPMVLVSRRSGTGLVSNLRVSVFSTTVATLPSTEADCPGCFGIGAPRVIVPGELTFGQDSRASAVGRRFAISQTTTWQRGAHLLRLGGDWEHATNRAAMASQDPVQLTLWAPSRVRQLDSSIALPASFSTVDDVLALPMRGFTTAVGIRGRAVDGLRRQSHL